KAGGGGGGGGWSRGGGGHSRTGGERETRSNEEKVYLFFLRTVPQLRALIPAAKLSSDTSPQPPPPPSSSNARPHLGTSSLLKLKRHQDFHCSFRRTWGKYHSTRKNLILCAAAEAAAAAAATVNMSLKADAEPNNNVSIEEEVRTLFVSGLPVDIKPRELYLLFRPFKGYEGSLIKLTSKQPVGFVTFDSRSGAEAAKNALNVSIAFIFSDSSLLTESFAV
uniref:RNA-binding protein with multiple splicing n=1 Tax=Stegastes partitus TaxID=144197 RepID=A0A3B4ZLP8_9TELE